MKLKIDWKALGKALWNAVTQTNPVTTTMTTGK